MHLHAYPSLLYLHLQTLTTVLIKHAIMADRVLMASAITRVTALKDLLEITVRLVRSCRRRYCCCGWGFNKVFKLMQ